MSHERPVEPVLKARSTAANAPLVKESVAVST
jgi:hypothetical protein